MDFVFSEKENDDGVFDNNHGMDYHIPVSGGVTKEPPMHIVHISVEMAPIAKVIFQISFFTCIIKLNSNNIKCIYITKGLMLKITMEKCNKSLCTFI